MSNFDVFKKTVTKYLIANGADTSFLSTLRETSREEDTDRYRYQGERDLEVVSMKLLAKKGYSEAKHTRPHGRPAAAADAFLISRENEWYFIEFTDELIGPEYMEIEDRMMQTAYENWYMVLDILYAVMDQGEGREIFDLSNPVRFAKSHVHYILVCGVENNIHTYNQIKNNALVNRTYTPLFMQRVKDYIFKDACVYTSEFFEHIFVRKFKY